MLIGRTSVQGLGLRAQVGVLYGPRVSRQNSYCVSTVRTDHVDCSAYQGCSAHYLVTLSTNVLEIDTVTTPTCKGWHKYIYYSLLFLLIVVVSSTPVRILKSTTFAVYDSSDGYDGHDNHADASR